MITDIFTTQHARDLDQACSDLALQATNEEKKQLLEFLAQLLKWNKTYNLTAIREPKQALVQHVFDSLAIIAPLLKHIKEQNLNTIRILDVGSGAGLPGVVIAIMIPNTEVTCVDTVGKKMTFVRQIAGVLKLRNLSAIQSRVEQLKAEPYDIVTSRAFSNLVDFAQLAGEHVKKDGVLVGMKGKEPHQEIEELEKNTNWYVDKVESLNVPELNAQRCLVWMKKKEHND